MIFNLNKSHFGRGKYLWDGESPIEWDDDGADWMMAIPVSGTLTILAGIPLADICIVAGGMPGKDGIVSSSPNGVGGNGGEVVEATNISLPAGEYTVTIGGSGQDTVLASPDGRSWTAESGGGSAGGRPGADGVFAWGDSTTIVNAGWRYGAGGGSGATHVQGDDRQDSAPGGSVGAASDDTMVGHGGGIGTKAEEHQQGWDGCSGTGQGGGGGRYWWNNGWQGREGGAGGSGIILIRFHKEVSS